MAPVAGQDIGPAVTVYICDAKALPKTGGMGDIGLFKLSVVIHKNLQGHPFPRNDEVRPAVAVEIRECRAGDDADIIEVDITHGDREMTLAVIQVEMGGLRHSIVR